MSGLLLESVHFHHARCPHEMGSISRAAEKLYISQPSLSQLLKSVEKKVGAPLFDRGSQPLRPTTIGQKYLETAQRIMELDKSFTATSKMSSAVHRETSSSAARRSAARTFLPRSCLSSRLRTQASGCSSRSTRRSASRRPCSPVTLTSSSRRSLSTPRPSRLLNSTRRRWCRPSRRYEFVEEVPSAKGLPRHAALLSIGLLRTRPSSRCTASRSSTSKVALALRGSGASSRRSTCRRAAWRR